MVMNTLLSTRIRLHRNYPTSLLLLNMYELQFISLISMENFDRFYRAVAQTILIFPFKGSRSIEQMRIPIIINFCLSLVLVMLLLLSVFHDKFWGRNLIVEKIASLVMHFRYVAFVPVCCLNFPALMQPALTGVDIAMQVFSGSNLVVGFLASGAQVWSNWSNRFLEPDHCNRKHNSLLLFIFETVFVFCCLGTNNMIVKSVIFIALALFKGYQVVSILQPALIQKNTFFYTFFDIYISIWCISSKERQNQQKTFVTQTFYFIIGGIVGKFFSQCASSFVLYWYANQSVIEQIGLGKQKNRQNQFNEQKISEDIDNLTYNDVLSFSRILLSTYPLKTKQYLLCSQNKEQFSLLYPKLCFLSLCQKMSPNSQEYSQSHMSILPFVERCLQQLDGGNPSPRTKITHLFFYVQIYRKPLKAYHQVMKMMDQDVGVLFRAHLHLLVYEARQCFQRIFVQNRILNRQLNLFKIIKLQEIIQETQVLIKQLIENLILYMELFTQNSSKISKILEDSQKIIKLKSQIERNLEDLVLNYPESDHVNFFIFVYYQFLDVYKAKDKQFKTLIQEKNLRRRLFDKQQQQIFSKQFGVIYIDLVEQRGKIRKVTKNVCQMFEYNYQDMIGFNINLFMPRIYAKYHHKFLTNFIQLGKIKILAEKNRLLFGKNKKKFIFPFVARLKTQHLLNDEFGITALVRKQQTSSEFIMFSNNGQISQISEKVYDNIFQPVLKQIDKINKLCIFKMLPNLLQILSDGSAQQKPNQVYESLFFFTDSYMLYEKFRIQKEQKMQYSMMSNEQFISSVNIETDRYSYEPTFTGNSNHSINFYSQIMRNFLEQVPFNQLLSINLTYKVSKLKTEQFSVYLLEIITFTQIKPSIEVILNEYKRIAQYLSLYTFQSSVFNNIEKHFQRKQTEDILGLILSKNLKQNENFSEHLIPKKLIKILEQGSTYKQIEYMLTAGQEDDKPIPENLLIKSPSHKSSTTQNSENQSKKQLLVNGFNCPPVLDKNIMIWISMVLIVLLLFAIIYVSQVILLSKNMQQMHKDSMMGYQMLHLYQTMMSLKGTHSLLSTVPSWNTLLWAVRESADTVSRKFTADMGALGQLTASGAMGEQVQLYGQEGQRSHQLISVINYIEFEFKNWNTQTQQNYFMRYNYGAIKRALVKFAKNNEKNVEIKIVSIFFAIYLMLVFIACFSWIPVFVNVTTQQKQILELLKTLKTQELVKWCHRLKFLHQNLKISKSFHIYSLLHDFPDDKLEMTVKQNAEYQNQNVLKGVRISYESGWQKIKVSWVIIGYLVFVCIFSVLPVGFLIGILEQKRQFSIGMSIISSTYGLANKPSEILNKCLPPITQILINQSYSEFSLEQFEFQSDDDFSLLNFIERMNKIEKDVVNASSSLFSNPICQQIECKGALSQMPASYNKSFYQITISINTLFTTEFGNKNMTKITKQEIRKWIDENAVISNIVQMINVYTFTQKWIQTFSESLESSLQQTFNVFACVAAFALSFYIVFGWILRKRLIIKLTNILKESENVHMHLPIHLLAQNTYLTSYFNNKIKNNK